jgi:hypothetical protein
VGRVDNLLFSLPVDVEIGCRRYQGYMKPYNAHRHGDGIIVDST